MAKPKRARKPKADESGTVDCPRCGTPVTATPVMILQPNSAGLRALFEGTLNRVSCPACGTAFVIDVPVIYRDDAKRFLIYFTRVEDTELREEMGRQFQEVTEKIFGEETGLPLPACRLVTDYSALMEKIAIHERGLDDRVIEYIKYQMFRNPNMKDRLDPLRDRLLYDFSRRGEEEEIVAFIVVDSKTGQPRAGAHLPIEVYRETARLFATSFDMRDALAELFPGHEVDVRSLL